MAQTLLIKYKLNPVRDLKVVLDTLLPAKEKNVALRQLGNRIANAIGYDESDNTVVLVREKVFDTIL